MLAARHREDHSCSPLYCLSQCIICSRVTGMKSYHHIYRRYALIFSNIPLVKMQLLISIFFCQLITFFNHICFQIQTNDIYVIPLYLPEIIIHGKGQVAFSAAKIQNCNFSVPGKLGQNILNKLQKPVNLSKFVIF